MSSTNFDASKFHIPRWEEIPSVDLYMDQVLSYIETCLSNYIKSDTDEKIITKTMINNYVKHEIISPPQNKKYNKLHIAELFVICILKQVYSIGDIKQFIKIALNTSTADTSYNNFCSILEHSLISTFNDTSLSNFQTTTKEQYLLKNVVQSFACKLYVQLNI